MRPVSISRVSQPFADPGSYASRSDAHGPAGHHTGVDFGSAWPISIDGRTVRSVFRGVVVISEHNDTMGNWVGVWDPDEDVTYTYWHLDPRSVAVGEHLALGHPIGKVGNTGNSDGPHLHVQANPGRGFDYHGHIRPVLAQGRTGPRILKSRQRHRDHGAADHNKEEDVMQPADFDRIADIVEKKLGPVEKALAAFRANTVERDKAAAARNRQALDALARLEQATDEQARAEQIRRLRESLTE